LKKTSKKIIVISDTHGYSFYDKIPECDILLICGDISPVKGDHSFYFQQQWFYNTFLPELKNVKAKNIVFIAGNHDTFLSETFISKNNELIKSNLDDNIYYLCDDYVIIDGIKIYGSPWVVLPSWARKGPPVWNFADHDENLIERYMFIPNDIDILITHGPVHRFCDVILDQITIDYNIKNFNSKPENLGSKSLASIIKSKKINPKYVFSGHIHSANHQSNRIVDENLKTLTEFYCTSILDEDYKYNYKPLEIIYE
jgi:Icc-related predicted phosphoesterase